MSLKQQTPGLNVAAVDRFVAAEVSNAASATGVAVRALIPPAPSSAPPALHFVSATLGNDGTTTWTAGGGGLYTVPVVLAGSSDGSAWDATAHAWTVPVTGLYQLTGTLRPSDGYPAGSNIGIGIDTSQNGGPDFIWHDVGTASRHTFQLTRTPRLTAGQQVSMFAYFEGPGTVGMAAMNVALVAAG